eukprot:UN22460
MIFFIFSKFIVAIQREVNWIQKLIFCPCGTYQDLKNLLVVFQRKKLLRDF